MTEPNTQVATAAGKGYRHLTGSEFSNYQISRNKAYVEFWLNQKAPEGMSAREFVEHIVAETGMSRPQVKAHLRVGAMLRRMPRLKAVVRQHWHLCERRLVAIEKQVCGINNDAVLAQVDAAVAARFTPQVPNEALIQPAAITLHVRAIVAELDPGAPSSKPDCSKRKGSVKRGEEGFTRFSFNMLDDEGLEVRLSLDKRLTKLQRAEYERAKKEGTEPRHFDLVDALVDLVRDGSDVKVHLNLLESPDGVLHLNGAGPLSGEQAATWRERATERLLSASKQVEKYAPTEEIRTTVQLLDGHCRFPGCDVPAIYCELDHRIEYDEGGATTADNLYCLCAYHHHGKTERQYFYEATPDRELTWHFRNGTTKTTLPQGPAVTRRFWAATWDDTEQARTTRRREHNTASAASGVASGSTSEAVSDARRAAG